MYFKINPTGCGENKGRVEVRYDLYLDSGDYGYSDHYVQVPVIIKEYSGKVDESGAPVDIEDYQKWHDGLERVWQNNPFCCHFVQFEPTVTDAEILERGEEVLAMAYKNHLNDDLRANTNPYVAKSTDATKIASCASRAASIKTTDFKSLDKDSLFSIK